MQIRGIRTGTAAFLLAAGFASADVVIFSAFENATNANLDGLNLSVDLVSGGSVVDFVFRNDSVIPSVVTAIYFENTTMSSSLLLNGTIMTPQELSVNFAPGATPRKPPGSIAATGPWGGSLMSLSAAAPSPHNGLSPGESVTVRFELGDSYQSLISGLSAEPPAFRIAQHVQGLPGSASVWTTSQASRTIPAPGTGALMLAALGFAGMRRRC